MHRKGIFALGLFPTLLSARELHSRRSVICSFSTAASNGNTCQSFAGAWGLTLDQFVSLNPGLSCPNLVAGHSYCVVGTVSTVTTTSTTSSSTPPVTTSTTLSDSTKTASTTTAAKPGNGITTPTPIQPDMVSNCDAFYFVKKGDTCTKIASQYKLSLSDFQTWNPKVGSDCTGLWANTYACVSVIGYSPPPTSTLSSGNGIQTPTPTQPGIVNNCAKFQFIQNGDTCANVASKNGISLERFLQWNPQAGSDCAGLWANAYACVGIISYSLKSYYHTDCTGDVHNTVSIVDGSNGMCIDTGCAVGSVDVALGGLCPRGQVQLSYWENPGCIGKWFGYGYMSRGQCHKMWTEGWKFKSLHLRCTREQDDCVNQKTCTYDPEPPNNLC
ncbi:LysM domain-containing protein [Pochonia chlamydosporia 170]|uniref:LysM domain-containing protein n=1 Tax=Pochonia chlamydosporia 170 TaxID=1380566 RepID=A0A179F4X1_METCM|nr:LysM domain-containing protein [Pochonia chlamydosporia 170]OAQ60452.1 LysM domain-containing protein [Pochonia chlamydosporia 170]